MVTEIKSVDPRVKRTRQLLQQAFFDLMNEKSFRSISVQDIAERATVNRATFYAHFEDKYALLDSCIRESFQQLLAERLPALSSLSATNLHILILAVFELISQIHGGTCSPSHKQLDPLFEEAVQQELYKVLYDWLKHAVPVDANRTEQVEVTATAISWAIFGSAVRWSQSSRTLHKEEMANRVMQVVNGGLSQVVSLAAD